VDVVRTAIVVDGIVAGSSIDGAAGVVAVDGIVAAISLVVLSPLFLILAVLV